jgi:uncharacterized protein involved in outer membrane biogenesis
LTVLRRILIALVVVVLLAGAAVYWFLSGEGIRLALEQQATAWLGHPVRIESASGRLFPRVGVQLGNVRVGEPVRLALADVEVSTGLRALLSRRVEDAEIILSDSRIDLPLPFSLPTSDSGETAEATSSSFEVASISRIALRDITVASRGREIVVSADSSLDGTRLTLEGFTARSGETAIEVSGVADLAPALNAKLEASANQLDFDDLMALADAFTPQQPARRTSSRSGALLTGRVEAKLTAARGSAAGVNLEGMSAMLVVKGNHVTLSPMSFNLFGGAYQGGVEADLGAERMNVALNSRINNLDVAQLAAFGGVDDTITGRLTGSGRFTGRGIDFASVLAAAAGSGNATISDGTIRGLELVRTVVLFFGRPSSEAPPGTGQRFDRIAGTFKLARQVLTSDSLTMHTPDMDLAASGTLAIPTKALDLRATLMLSEQLSAQAGTDLVRFTREGNRVVLPAVIGGTLERPRVTIDAAAAAKRGLRNEVERRLKGLFDRIKPPSPK